MLLDIAHEMPVHSHLDAARHEGYVAALGRRDVEEQVGISRTLPHYLSQILHERGCELVKWHIEGNLLYELVLHLG